MLACTAAGTTPGSDAATVAAKSSADVLVPNWDSVADSEGAARGGGGGAGGGGAGGGGTPIPAHPPSAVVLKCTYPTPGGGGEGDDGGGGDGGGATGGHADDEPHVAVTYIALAAFSGLHLPVFVRLLGLPVGPVGG